jgi:hypothetical protein
MEASEILRILFDVNAEGNKIFVDERRQTGVFVRLVFEPLTGPSGRSRAEIYQQRFFLLFGLRQSFVGVFDPIYGHSCDLH